LQDKQVIDVIDKQTWRSNLVELIYFDIHQHAVWHNMIALEAVEYFKVNYNKGYFVRNSERSFDSDRSHLHPSGEIKKFIV
jgi:hypothetical protein